MMQRAECCDTGSNPVGTSGVKKQKIHACRSWYSVLSYKQKEAVLNAAACTGLKIKAGLPECPKGGDLGSQVQILYPTRYVCRTEVIRPDEETVLKTVNPDAKGLWVRVLLLPPV